MELTGFLQILQHSVAGLSFQSRIWVEMPRLYPFKSGGWLFQKIFQHTSFQPPDVPTNLFKLCWEICLNLRGQIRLKL